MQEQINQEMFSLYLHLSMAAHFEEKNIPGFAHWMRVQADEERGTATSMLDHRLAKRAGE